MSARVGEPTEIARAAVFLASEKSSFITEGVDHGSLYS
jgi:NAD(P)-dependent dehydrogenase (short-subunit alcohol dehydrogenase family)